MPFDFETSLDYINTLGGNTLTTFTIANNQATPAVVESFSAATYSVIHLKYSLTRGSDTSGGEMTLGTNGVTSFLTQVSGETAAQGVTFTADYTAGNIRLMYTSTNTGSSGTLKYRVDKWLA